jgi:hypothetical protein
VDTGVQASVEYVGVNSAEGFEALSTVEIGDVTIDNQLFREQITFFFWFRPHKVLIINLQYLQRL